MSRQADYKKLLAEATDELHRLTIWYESAKKTAPASILEYAKLKISILQDLIEHFKDRLYLISKGME